MTRPVVFSASSVNTWLNCHLQWWFSYVLVAEGASSEAQRVGIAVHDYAEAVLTDRISPSMGEIAPLALVFTRDILPTYGTPVLIEEAFQIEINGIPYSGVIDALDRQDDVFILRDLKTTGSKPSPGRYRFAMTGYYLGVTEGLGQPVHGMQLDYIVRTKKPYYLAEPIPIPSREDLETFAGLLDRVANEVDQGAYQPTGLGTWVCSWCPHAQACGPYQRYREDTNG